MVYEVAKLTIIAGSEPAIEDVLSQAVPLIQQSPGALSLRVDRTLENMSEYTLIVGWATLEDHTEGFLSPWHVPGRRNSQELTSRPPQVKHNHQAYVGF